MPFLPITKKEMRRLGWEQPDVVLVTGDAYVDHSSFGTAIISRVMEAKGYKVCILSQPRSLQDFERFGRPKYGFFVNGGNIDSMVAHYTVAGKRRHDDAYTPGGKTGARPDRATIVYCQQIREVYGEIPIVIGGLEASLRRFAHYDYWDNKVRPSILVDSGADLLIYGMGEKQVIQILERMAAGMPMEAMQDIRGICYMGEEAVIDQMQQSQQPFALCPSFSKVRGKDPKGMREYAISCRIQQDEHDAVRGKTVLQRHGDRVLVQNPPMMPLSQEELDWVYELPYMREPHPSYEAMGGVPGIQEVKFSITHNRGCFGACNFCSLAFHQGRMVTCRSIQSVVKEAEELSKLPDFKGYIHDVGGPTANFRRTSCEKQLKSGLCKGKKCLAPTTCPALKADHSEYLQLLRKLRTIKGVKKVFIRSGIRFDYLLEDPNPEFFKDLVEHHISGQLRVAPEHCSGPVLDKMGKPSIEVYRKFQKQFYKQTEKVGLKQYLVPYLMSSHPGSTMKDAIALAEFLNQELIHPDQVQDFYPTPGTVSTCMFYTGLDPYTLEPVYVPKTPKEKEKQRALLQYFMPKNYDLVKRTLIEEGRSDLIGFGKECLISPRKPAASLDKKPKNVRK